MLWHWKKQSTLDPLSVAMVGVKLADRVLVIGCRDPKLIAALAIKAGLTGRTCAVDRSEDVVNRAGVIALKEGALVEFATATSATLPYDNAVFDVVVLRDVMSGADANDRATIAAESARLLRPGGRCMIIDTIGGGVAALFGKSASVDPGAVEALTAALKTAGFVAVRELAERDGLLFLEAVKKA
jgi:ubiquinone/menaquinone biosynthesis C-methylase UbiE